MKSILKFFFLLAILAISTSAQGQNLNTCLLLDMPFDGSIADQGPNSYSTSFTGGTPNYTTDRKGVASGAVVLDGINDFITLNGNSPVITTTSFSISVWIKMSGSGGGVHNRNSVFSQRDDATGNVSAVVINTNSSGDMMVTVNKSGSNVVAVIANPNLVYNQWYHIVMVVSGSTLSYYFNGQLFGTTNILGTGNYNSSVDYVNIGRHRNALTNSGFFNGAIDDKTRIG